MAPVTTNQNDVDYKHAAVLVAKRLALLNIERPILVGVLPGGELAKAVASELCIPVEILPVRPLKDPAAGMRNIGIVTEHEAALHQCPFDLPQDYIYHETLRLRSEIVEEKKLRRGSLSPETVSNRTIIIVDNGLWSGDTMHAAIKEVRRFNPARIIVAVANATSHGTSRIKGICDDIIVLERQLRPTVANG